MRILPHRYPFLMIDCVQEIHEGPNTNSREGRRSVAIKSVSANEHYFVGHFPGRPIMPGVLIIEAMAQAGALAFYRYGDPPMNVAIASVKDAKFRRPVLPGDRLVINAEILRDRGQMLLIASTVQVDGQLVAEATILASVTQG